MPAKQSRGQFLAANPHVSAWAALDEATNAQMKITPGAITLKKGSCAGKTAIIIGAGVGGLTTAYELLVHETGMQVIVLEAQNRTGGRCMSLRTGDTFTEDQDSDLFKSEPGETQTVRFKRPVGDSAPYLNAGPGRIPSAHKRLLGYLRDFGVDVEVYLMNSMANLVQIDGGPFKSEPQIYRQIDHNVRGWLAQMVHENAAKLLASTTIGVADKDQPRRVAQLQDLMVSFGELDVQGRYAPTPGDDGFENAISRAGFDVLPGVDVGVIAKAISLDVLLESEFWKKTRFYQPSDFLWQPTLFQPVGGMDQVQHAFAQQVAALGGTIHLTSPVKSIDWDAATSQFVIQVSQIGTKAVLEYRADYCFANLAMPFLSKILSDDLQASAKAKGFSEEFKAGLHAVYAAQFKPKAAADSDGYVDRFLATTSKVGWQAHRSLWQGSPMTHRPEANRLSTLSVPEAEVGVVPIFGGISWTSHDIVQIWYPSTGYHDQLGVLTGAYNFSKIAWAWGKLPVAKRLEKARQGARKFGKAFGDGLGDGVAIAWQNMPHIKGGWAQWQALGEAQVAVKHFNNLTQGTGVTGADGTLSKPNFFIVGDQLSSLPGWQEGAIAAALNALSRLAQPGYAIPWLKALPDTRLMVEGI
jgi:monoamine oxidase